MAEYKGNEELRGKSALVTGASRGIGAATAIALARRGVSRIWIHYGGYKEGAETIRKEVRAAGAESELLQADLTKQSGIEQLMEQVTKNEPDILINNAGSLIKRAKLAEYSSDLWDRMDRLNVKSVYFLSQAAAPAMTRKRWGVIINVSSIAARTGGGPGATVYSANKAAVSTLTKGLAKELAPNGIRVNAVSPGTVDNHYHEQFSTRELLDSIAKSTPAGRLATNEDIAEAIVFLCSEASSYILGQTIEINGGAYMP